MKTIVNIFRLILVTLIGYFLYACAAPLLAIGGITANLAFATLAIILVSRSRMEVFSASCILGILIDTMLGNVPSLYLLGYPIITVLFIKPFADKTDKQLEEARMRRTNRARRPNLWTRLKSKLPHRKRVQENAPPLFRALLCAALMDGVLSLIVCIYISLNGAQITWTSFMRILGGMVYTFAATFVLYFPARLLLGVYHKKPKKKGGNIA